MPGQEELVQQPVHLQKSVAIQQHLIPFNRQKTPVLQALQRVGETLYRIDAEFVSEIRQAQMAELELQNELANQPFIVARRLRPVDRHFALLDLCDVGIEVSVVL